MISKISTRYFAIADCSCGELLEQMEAWRREGTRRTVCFCDGNGLPRAWRGDVALRQAYAHADAVCPDGIATAALARIYGGRVSRLTGPQLFVAALEYGVSRGWRHFFYGTDAATLAALKANVEAKFPGVKIVGTYAPAFADDPALPPADAAPCDFFWVALGCPKQEKWSERHRNDVNATVVLSVGAAFDFIAGRATEAPRGIQALGLNWLWRLLTGGRRVFARNVRCVAASAGLLLRELASRLVREMKERP